MFFCFYYGLPITLITFQIHNSGSQSEGAKHREKYSQNMETGGSMYWLIDKLAE